MTDNPNPLLELTGYAASALINGAFIGVVPYIFFIVFFTAIWFLFGRSFERPYPQILAFASIGIFLGMFTGASKEPIVAAMLPATITLISGFTVYFFEKKEGEAKTLDTSALPSMLCALVIMASFGAYYAAHVRTISLRNEEALKLNWERNKIEYAEISVKINRVKKCLQAFEKQPDIQKTCGQLLQTK